MFPGRNGERTPSSSSSSCSDKDSISPPWSSRVHSLVPFDFNNEDLEPVSESDFETPDEDEFYDYDEAPFSLRIDTLTGSTFHIITNVFDTVDIIKTKISMQEGIESYQQHLILWDRELQDDEVVQDLGLSEDTIVKLVLSLKGGPFPSRKIGAVPSAFDIDELPDLLLDQTGLSLYMPEDCSDVVLRDLDTGRTYVLRVSFTGEDSDSSKTNPSTAAPRRSSLRNEPERIQENSVTMAKVYMLKSQMAFRKKAKPFLKVSKKRDRDSFSLPPLVSKPMTAVRVTSASRRDPRSPSGRNLFQSSVGNTTSVEANLYTMHRITTDIYLQRNRACPGQAPYNHQQLCKYVNAKVNLLLSSENQNSCLPRVSKYNQNIQQQKKGLIRLIPTVVFHRLYESPNCVTPDTPLSKVMSSGTETSSGRYRRRKSAVNDLGSVPVTLLSSSSTLPKLLSSRPKTAVAVISRPITARRKVVTNALGKRCDVCRKKLGLASKYECRCGRLFCGTHRYAETHNCSYDYKAEGKRILSKNNPQVKPEKMNKL